MAALTAFIICEMESEHSTLSNIIPLWDDLKDIAEGKRKGDLKVEFKTMVDLIWGNDSDYRNNIYKDFRDLIVLPLKLQNEHYKKICLELDTYHYSWSQF